MEEEMEGLTLYRLTRESDGLVANIAAMNIEDMLSKLYENYPPNQDRWKVQQLIQDKPLKATKISWP